MKATTLLAMASVFVLAGCSQTDGRADVTSGDQPIPISATELEWVDIDPVGAPGVRLATLWGDPTSGAFGAFFRLPAGFAAPLHTHTHPMKVVIVSGTCTQEPEGEAVFHLGPGSFLMQPGGDYRHLTGCNPGSDCVFFVESSGPFGLLAAEASPSGN